MCTNYCSRYEIHNAMPVYLHCRSLKTLLLQGNRLTSLPPELGEPLALTPTHTPSRNPTTIASHIATSFNPATALERETFAFVYFSSVTG